MLERPIPILDIIAPLLLIRINIITVRLPEAEAGQWGHQWQRLPGRLWRRESTKGSPTTSGTRESRCTFVSPDASEDSDWFWTNCPRWEASWVSPTRHATTGIKSPPQLIRNSQRVFLERGIIEAPRVYFGKECLPSWKFRLLQNQFNWRQVAGVNSYRTLAPCTHTRFRSWHTSMYSEIFHFHFKCCSNYAICNAMNIVSNWTHINIFWCWMVRRPFWDWFRSSIQPPTRHRSNLNIGSYDRRC